MIAIIDGNFLARRYLERLLAAAGYGTDSFATADEFLLDAGTCKANCIVLDIELKNSSGRSLAHHPSILALRCPIIFSSTAVNDDLEQQAHELGGIALVRKPFRAVDILSALAKVSQNR
jgi:FixJ family two-component response regulator